MGDLVNMTQLRQFVATENEIKILERRLKAAKARKQQLDEALTPTLIAEGLPSVKIRQPAAENTLRFLRGELDQLAVAMPEEKLVSVMYGARGPIIFGSLSELREFSELLQEYFLQIDSEKSGRTVYIHPTLYVSPVKVDDAEGGEDGEDISAGRRAIVAALKETEWAEIVKENYNSNTLTAAVRGIAEMVKEDCRLKDIPFTEEMILEALPEPLRDKVKVSTKHGLRSRA